MTLMPAWPGVEVWRGGVNTWECDEMGHMNVRFYVAKAMEGLVGLSAALGLAQAFAPHGNATLLLRDQHIRFLREAHAGAQLHMLGSVLDFGETDATVQLLLVHSMTAELAASFQMRVAHVTPRQARAFPWAPNTRERAAVLMAEVPSAARPRSLSLKPFVSQARQDRAERLGLACIGLGAIGPADVDVFGRMRAEQFIGRVSDGVGRFVQPFRNLVVAHAEHPPTRVGGAVLEYRLTHLDWPMVGERIAIRSGLTGYDAKTLRAVHWLLDPETGDPWGTSEAVVITFDLDARKIVPISERAAQALHPTVVVGLTA